MLDNTTFTTLFGPNQGVQTARSDTIVQASTTNRTHVLLATHVRAKTCNPLHNAQLEICATTPILHSRGAHPDTHRRPAQLPVTLLKLLATVDTTRGQTPTLSTSAHLVLLVLNATRRQSCVSKVSMRMLVLRLAHVVKLVISVHRLTSVKELPVHQVSTQLQAHKIATQYPTTCTHLLSRLVKDQSGAQTVTMPLLVVQLVALNALLANNAQVIP